jgi:lipoprotein-anchoring transpeptidase ErfK/SrfK
MFDVRAATVVCMTCLLAAACGSQTSPVREQRALAANAVGCGARSEPLGSARVAYAALAVRRLHAFRKPGRRPFARFGTLNKNGVPTVFGVRGVLTRRDCSRWYRVQLPRRPNGVEGWVRGADVELAKVRARVEVDLSSRRVTLFRDGRPVLRTIGAIGSPATPTPTGSYYVNQRLIVQDPTGPFGPEVIGISAFSEVLTWWTQGGPIAIHGTNQPWTVGKAVSNGCVRVRNDVLRRLFRQAIAGTPVIIHP